MLEDVYKRQGSYLPLIIVGAIIVGLLVLVIVLALSLIHI